MYPHSGSRKRSSSYSAAPYKKPRSVPQTAARYIPRPPVPENKYFDSVLAATSIPATAASWASTELDPTTLNCLFAPVQGTGISDRIGRKVHVTKLKLRGVVHYTSVTSQTVVKPFPWVRIIVVQDMQTNGAQLNGEDVMQASTTAAAISQTVTYQNLANFGRFKILKDKTIMMNTVENADNANVTSGSIDFGNYPFKCTIKFRKPVVVHYNSTNGGTVADAVDNSFHVLAIGTDTSCQLLYSCRTVFVDA